mmetsp:Transcript_15591/g.20011  ORF Transcript_15591/g.20011 Transcript_15591/m.20011 type:complete len:412 (+) Transcript_15591:325-1560(+)
MTGSTSTERASEGKGSENAATDACRVCGMQMEPYVYTPPWTLRRNAFKSSKDYLFVKSSKLVRGLGLGKITQGNHSAFSHSGVMAHSWDLALPQGTPIVANRDGVVVDFAQHFKKGGIDPDLRNKANFVILRFADGTYGRYFHVKHKSVRVKKGAVVKKGDVIADCGSTGYSAGPHIHFDVLNQYVKEIGSVHIRGDNNMAWTQIECTVANISCKLPPKDEFLELQMHLDPSKYCDDYTSSEYGDQEQAALVCYRGRNIFSNKAEIAEKRGAKALIIIDNDYSMKGVLAQIGVVDKLIGEEQKKDSVVFQEDLVEILALRKLNLRETLQEIPIFFVSARSGDILVRAIKSGRKAIRLSTHEHNSRPDDHPYRLPITVPINLATNHRNDSEDSERPESDDIPSSSDPTEEEL